MKSGQWNLLFFSYFEQVKTVRKDDVAPVEMCYNLLHMNEITVFSEIYRQVNLLFSRNLLGKSGYDINVIRQSAVQMRK